jgi:hypothetical protein
MPEDSNLTLDEALKQKRLGSNLRGKIARFQIRAIMALARNYTASERLRNRLC